MKTVLLSAYQRIIQSAWIVLSAEPRRRAQWVYLGLFSQWRSRPTYGYREGETYVAIMQGWALYFFGLRIWRSFPTVGEITVNQWAARCPIGDNALTDEQFHRFSAKE